MALMAASRPHHRHPQHPLEKQERIASSLASMWMMLVMMMMMRRGRAAMSLVEQSLAWATGSMWLLIHTMEMDPSLAKVLGVWRLWLLGVVVVVEEEKGGVEMRAVTRAVGGCVLVANACGRRRKRARHRW